MTQLSLGEAAKLSGRNKTTIFRAMKSGKLSYSVNGAGERRIAVAELERVFPPATEKATAGNPPQQALLAAQIAQLEDTNADLRRRLDDSERERREGQGRLLATLERLTAQLSAPAAQPPAPPQKRGWRRWFG
jgi:hypothetical protein